MSAPARLVAGVDVGGTFTDVFCFDEASGACSVAKVPSTHDDQSRGFMDGIRARVDDLADLTNVVHGTTVGTNALLQRRGARTGVITTRGFRDVLEMRRRDRPNTWGLWGAPERPATLSVNWQPEIRLPGSTRFASIPPPPNVARLAVNEESVQMSLPLSWTLRPPPSAAELPVKLQPLIVVSPPRTDTPPPSLSAWFPSNAVSTRTTEAPDAKIAPPRKLAVLS